MDTDVDYLEEECPGETEWPDDDWCPDDQCFDEDSIDPNWIKISTDKSWAGWPHTMEDQQDWCRENTKSNYEHCLGNFWFESKKDATMFILKWS